MSSYDIRPPCVRRRESVPSSSTGGPTAADLGWRSWQALDCVDTWHACALTSWTNEYARVSHMRKGGKSYALE